MSRRVLWLGVALCYGLAYTVLLLVAVCKELDITSGYSLVVWSVAAFVLAAVCAVPSLGLAAVVGKWRLQPGRFFPIWALSILLVGTALIVYAR